MYAILNTRMFYGGKTTKQFVTEPTSMRNQPEIFANKADAEGRLEQIGGGPMHLGHNEYSNRYAVRKLTAAQEARLA